MSNDADISELDSSVLDGAESAISAVTKETKRTWFHSLTRRRKTETSTNSSTQNNNNESVRTESTASSSIADERAVCSSSQGATRKQAKDKKNAFQRFRKKVELRLNLMRPWRAVNENAVGGSGTTDATSEFVAHACIDPSLPFTHDYIRFISKKWLQQDDGPNRVMYKACTEMLNQVWYWGEISRRDAQKELTDKPTGSFLVRDSETSGSQFTLSFRIVNVTLHYRLEYRDDSWHFEELKYTSIVEMIEDILHRCTNDNFVCFVKVSNEMQPPFPVILKYPLSRYLNLPKLQDLCRRVIQRHVSQDEIPKLPVPIQMLEYLSVKRELVF